MNTNLTPFSWVIPAGVGIFALGILVYLGMANIPLEEVPLRVPLVAERGVGAVAEQEPLAQRKLQLSGQLEQELPGQWLSFRGQHRDAISRDKTPLSEAWGEGGVRQLWSVDVGEGYAGAAVDAGRVYVMDYERETQRDALRCLSLVDGSELWRSSYPLKVNRNHGMSRTVPALAEGYVVALGPKCQVSCLDAITGELQWEIDLVRRYGCKVPPWYAGQCPLIDDGKVILAPAGEEVLMIAVDLQSGDVIWEVPNPMAWKMTHVSIVPAMLCGKKTYVYCGSRGVVGVAADRGQILWQSKAWRISIATVCSPLPLPDNRLFFSGGYKAGSLMMEVSEEQGEWAIEEVFRLDADDFGATQQTPIFYQDYLYGVRPSGELCCLNQDGELQWSSWMEHRFGLGPFMVADGKLLVMDDEGNLAMVRAMPERFQLLDEAKILDGHDSWGPLALAGGRLIARDLTRMVCVDLRKQTP